ncbi:unnamed protein product [Cuscuta campestris]|uniref:Alkyl transferase n=1 Tax=Cuscuta campestris TaxID=132261 RepID=A0A484MUY7_9ASTE|nr:unnamed protein product [Cuscuta campestris]VFQ92729.1 unnamed protein product [Cuscuta campestris]
MDIIRVIQKIAGLLFGSIFRGLRRLVFHVLSAGVVPEHVAFILDGNRRFAKKKKLPNETGYRAGFLALMCMLKYCHELGVRRVTLFIFSIDNFNRDPREVRFLMDLMLGKVEAMLKYENVLNKYGVRVVFLGNLSLLEEPLRAAAERAMDATGSNSGMVLFVCVAYASSDEMVRAARACCLEKRQELESSKDERAGDVTVADIERNMMWTELGREPDIIVRTAGANRLSNFLMWQTGNTMLYTTRALFPEIGLRHLVWAVLKFQRAQPFLHKIRVPSAMMT